MKKSFNKEKLDSKNLLSLKKRFNEEIWTEIVQTHTSFKYLVSARLCFEINRNHLKM